MWEDRGWEERFPRWQELAETEKNETLLLQDKSTKKQDLLEDLKFTKIPLFFRYIKNSSTTLPCCFTLTSHSTN